MTNASEPTNIRTRIASIVQEGFSHKAFTLVANGNVPLPAFEAGAHVDVHITSNIVRQYSLACSWAPDTPYLLCIKRENNSRGGSAYLYDEAKVGDELILSPPRNLFHLEDANYYVLVAAGIGITPILSMAQTLEKQHKNFVLHYYTRSKADTAFLASLEKGFSSGIVIFHYSEAGDSLRTNVPKDILTLSHAARICVCGPQGFIDHLHSHITMSGFPEERFHYEYFSPIATQNSMEDCSFDVEINSSKQTLHVPAGLSIAQVLHDAGIPITLSCEQGMCGACLTPVLEGIPDHRDSVQSQKEQSQNNFIAICCSRSKSGKLTLGL